MKGTYVTERYCEVLSTIMLLPHLTPSASLTVDSGELQEWRLVPCVLPLCAR